MAKSNRASQNRRQFREVIEERAEDAARIRFIAALVRTFGTRSGGTVSMTLPYAALSEIPEGESLSVEPVRNEEGVVTGTKYVLSYTGAGTQP